MEHFTVYLVFIFLLAMGSLVGAWERKRLYGEAEESNKLFLKRNREEAIARLQRNRKIGMTAQRAHLLGAYHYGKAHVMKQYLPIFVPIGLAFTLPLLLEQHYHFAAPGFGNPFLLLALSIWLFLAGFLLYLINRCKEAFCLIYDDALVFNRLSPLRPRWDDDPLQIPIPIQSLQWLGPCTRNIKRKIRQTRIPLRIAPPSFFINSYLEEWALIYSDGIYQYGLLFYPSEEMIRAFRQHFPNQTRTRLNSVL